MKIVHFTLGLSPQRSGGLTKYATDLILEQLKNKEQVYSLYPEYNFKSGYFQKNIIKERDRFDIPIYVLQNSALISLMYGVKKPISIVNNESRKINKESLDNFYNEVKPDIFHIHTLMGLSLELVSFFKDKGVKIVYTSHDYYGLCPRVNFIDYKGDLCENPDGKNCAICNYSAPSSLFLKIRNSQFVLKNKNILSFANIKSLSVKKTNNERNIKNITPDKIDGYNDLLLYYKKLFSYIDIFHFNSSLAKEVYEKHLKINHSVIISISHREIQDNRKITQKTNSTIQFGFIGNVSAYKGFPLLLELLMELKDEGINNWILNVWGNDNIEINDKAIKCQGKYNALDLNKVFSQMNLLIVPSIWKETFSLISLEAISFGVPVLITSNVGARDIISFYEPSFVVEPTKDALKDKLKEVLSDVSILLKYNQKILSEPFDFDFNTHVQKIKEQLYLE
jgi:glycosyltransferase involved in cell wall biosynthesis